jgi:phytoene/squalene synthetase
MTAAAPPRPAALPSHQDVMEQARHENFTVASVVLGRARQIHLMAIYGFARLVDDVGDEVAGDRALCSMRSNVSWSRSTPAAHPSTR